jgi:signal transduction histidine kinase
MREDDASELYEHAPCGLFSMTPDGTIVRANATMLELLRATRDQVIGTRFQDHLTMAGRIFHDTHYMPLLAMQGFAKEIAFDLYRADAPPLPAIITTTTGHRDEAGAVAGYRTVVMESTSRRSYEQELVRQRHAAEQAATARSAMLAMISHDIRSPLSSILMAIDLLEKATSVETRDRYTKVARRSAGSVLELVNAILDHSRLEAGVAQWEPQPTDLRTLLGEITAILSVKTEAKKIELRTQIDERVPETVMVDRFKLGQIITNLLSNAIKFTERGHVAVDVLVHELDAREAQIELRVSDTGIGIPADKLEVIFDEFQQATQATALRYGGTGLGLSISRRLAALAGSTIKVESTVGAGTTFSCRLRLKLKTNGTKLSTG